MSAIDTAISERYQFSLPSDYLKMRSAGCFDKQDPLYLQFTDLEWLSDVQIQNWVFDVQMIDGLIPCAQTLDGHVWAWYPAIDERHAAPLVFCPDEDEVAVIYAPDFLSGVYHMFLDELSHTFLVERGTLQQAQEQLQHFQQTLSAFFPAAWNERLAELVQRPLKPTQENFYGVLDEDEHDTILATDINYDRLDEEFCCVKEDE